LEVNKEEEVTWFYRVLGLYSKTTKEVTWFYIIEMMLGPEELMEARSERS